MKRLFVSISVAALVLGVSGCTSGGSSAEPYGGQCDLIAGPLAQSSMAMLVPGSANFGDMDTLQQKIWDAGFETLGDWMSQVESAHPAIQAADTSSMSAEEVANIQYLESALSSLEINKAVVIGDTQWFTETNDVLLTVGAACS
jgi:hypothetical protein